MPPLFRLPVVLLAMLAGVSLGIGDHRARPAPAPRPAPHAPGPVDAHGDPLPPGVVARFGTIRFRTHDQLEQLALSPNALFVVTPASGGALQVWNALTGLPLRTVPLLRQKVPPRFPDDQERSEPEGIVLMTFGREERRLYAVTDRGILRACDVITGEWTGPLAQAAPVPNPDRYDRRIPFAFVSRDGTHFGYSLPVKNYERELLRVEVLALGHEQPIYTLDRKKLKGLRVAGFTEDSKLFGVAEDGTAVKLYWDVIGGGAVTTLSPPAANMTLLSVTPTPNGQELAATYAPLRPGSSDSIDSFDGWWLVGYDRATGAERFRVPNWPGYVMGYSRDGAKFYSKGFTGAGIAVADVATRKITNRLQGHGRLGAERFVFSANRKYLATAGGRDRSITVWDLTTEKPVPDIDAPRGAVNAIAFSPDGNGVFTTTTEGRSGWVWDARTGALKRKLTADTKGLPQTAAFAPDNRHLVVGYGFGNGTGHGRGFEALLWDALEGKPVRAFGDHAEGVRAVALSPDGKHLATYGAARNGDDVSLWETDSGKQVRTSRWVPHHRDGLFSFRSAGELFGIAESELTRHKETVNLWTGKGLHAWNVPHTAQLRALSPDGRTVVTMERWDGTRELFTLRSAETGTELRRLPVPGFDYACQIAFSADSKIVAIGQNRYGHNGGFVRLYDVATGEHLRTIGPHPGGVSALAFSPNGSRLATGGTDTTVLIWDLTAKP